MFVDAAHEVKKNNLKIFYDFQYNNSLGKLIAPSAINKINFSSLRLNGVDGFLFNMYQLSFGEHRRQLVYVTKNMSSFNIKNSL